MKVACSPEAWPPRRPPAPSTTSKVCSPEEAWPPRRPPAPSTTRKVWPPAPPAPNRRVWGAIGAIVLLQTATIAAVLAPRPETDARRRLLDEEMIEPPLLKVREDHDLGEVDERRRLSGALWGLKTVTTATTLTKFMGTMVLCDTSSAAITVTLPAASDMSEQSGASLRHYKFINTGSNDCTIARAGSDTIVTSTLTATFAGGATTSTFTGTAFTPAGTVSQPTFTGTQFTPAGTISAITPAGTNDAPTFTGQAHTPTFTGGAITSTVTQGAITTATVYTGADGTATTTDTAVDVVTGVAVSTVASGTASGTISQITPQGTVAAPVFSGTPHTPTFTGTAVTPGGTVSQPTFTGTQVTPQGTIQTDTPGGTVAIVNAATASTGLTAITLKPGSSLALVGDGTSAWYQYGGTSIAVA